MRFKNLLVGYSISTYTFKSEDLDLIFLLFKLRGETRLFKAPTSSKILHDSNSEMLCETSFVTINIFRVLNF